nr:hypothetical protein [Alteribacter keqinensis]
MRRWTGLLLDQRFIVGIGNYLRSEILFAGKIPPSFRPKNCTDLQLRTASYAVIDLMTHSYDTGGITTYLDLVKKLKHKGLTIGNYRHGVFTVKISLVVYAVLKSVRLLPVQDGFIFVRNASHN